MQDLGLGIAENLYLPGLKIKRGEWFLEPAEGMDIPRKGVAFQYRNTINMWQRRR